jgi:hypothetical protein
MSDQDPSLLDLWRLLGNMNKRFGERFDVIERQMVALDARMGALDASVAARIATFDAKVTASLGALKESIEARDFRLDEQGRRLTKLEESIP